MLRHTYNAYPVRSKTSKQVQELPTSNYSDKISKRSVFSDLLNVGLEPYQVEHKHVV
jgi:hypothetical protein